jgi:dethiobiotin synthetase
MSSYFITATGTEMGKTYLTALLAKELQGLNLSPTVLKPIVSGFIPEENDTEILLKALEKPPTTANLDAMSPWRFTAPLTPALAAKKEGKHVTLEDLIRFCRPHTHDEICLIEGAGGLMSPLTDTASNLHLIKALAIPVLLITGTYLGSISHCLTAIETLKAHKITVHAIIVNETPHAQMTEETCHMLQTHTEDTRIVFLPFSQAPPHLSHSLALFPDKL